MKRVTVQPGASLSVLGYIEDVDWRDILDANPSLSPLEELKGGEQLRIPEQEDLEEPQTRVFGQLIDSRNKLIRLQLGSYASEAELLGELPQYQPTNAQIERAMGIGRVESLSNTVRARAEQRGVETIINWTNIE